MDEKNNKKFWKIEAIVFATLFFWAAVPMNIHADNNMYITLSFSYDEPIIDSGEVFLSGLPSMSNGGFPVLPVHPVSVLLPQGHSVDNILITHSALISLGLNFDLTLLQAEESFSGYIGILGTFDPSIPYPTEIFSIVGTYSFRGYTYVLLNIYPVHYIRRTGELYYYSDISITIQTKDDGNINNLFRGINKDELLLAQKVDDIRMAGTYTTSSSLPFSPLINPNDSFEYVIITADAFENSAFQDLVTYKQNQGVSATLVTLSEIYNNYVGVDNAEKIRNFIREAYRFWETDYILLGGDDSVVPVRDLWVDSLVGYTTTMPSDLYYGCLDGTYNYDGDSRWGEPTDGDIGGDVDLVAEVFVGRACVDSIAEISSFVSKTISYESTSSEYLKRALMVGERLGFGGPAEWGGNLKDEMINGSDAHGYVTVGIPGDEYDIDTLYERDGLWETQDIVNYLNDGTHIINHLGHGSETYAMKLGSDDILGLTNTEYCFIYSQTCLAGHFDDRDCIAEYLTVKTSHGAFAVIMNARYGWGRYGSTDGPSQRYDREFYDAIFGESTVLPDMRRIGVANQDSKEDNLYRINDHCMRWCYYELNLFGDPQVRLKEAYQPEHDIAVISITFPLHPGEEEFFDVNGTIINLGKNNETDIIIDFLVDDVVQDTALIEFLRSRERVDVTFSCSLLEGEHTLGIYAHPVPEDENLGNNLQTKMVYAGNDAPDTPVTPSGPTSGRPGMTGTYTTTTVDPENHAVKYGWDWNGDYVVDEWTEYLSSGEVCTVVYTWNRAGSYEVRVKALDTWGLESNWSEMLIVTITNDAPCKPAKPSGPTIVKPWVTYTFSSSTVDPDDDQVSYQWDFGGGAGTWSSYYPSGRIVTQTHRWRFSDLGRTFEIRVRARDVHGATSPWSEPLRVTVKLNSGYSISEIAMIQQQISAEEFKIFQQELLEYNEMQTESIYEKYVVDSLSPT